ncbi:hypothetical protein [Mangrovimonas sp. YM274]|uniref:hypothetical protein n=1 Tax=Mangrovimonas sp. YM274 TaxID=3070660 RepID=UPI0027DE9D9E|nr:hypothetical protein [Mangrovimonas sp. YM274]WMI69523.1 hypothetical protein RBH95_03940 [Mangrovimonas sp. YM274]
MKTLLIVLVTSLMSVLCMAQSQNGADVDGSNNVTFESISISVSAENMQDLKELNLEDIQDIFGNAEADREVSFEIVCYGKPMKNGKKASLAMKADGNSNDLEAFYNQIKMIKKMALGYYN